MIKKLKFIFCFLIVSLTTQAQDAWHELKVDKKLTGWKQLGGSAKYFIEDGNTIVGEAVLNSPNSFLTTNERYADFVLEFEFYSNTLMNSGVQFRSNSLPDYKDGRVHGYQMEIDPTDRGYTGGIYDEGRRKWLYPLSRNVKARTAFKLAQWNKMHIEVIGNTINTWVNGVHCASLVDDMTAEGFIGLQVHSVGAKSGLEGAQVKWKNLRIATENLEDYQWNLDPTTAEISYLNNELTESEVKKGWRLLWDGKTSDGWRGAKLDQFPKSGWEIAEGVLTVKETDGGESTGPGDIITNDQFRDFELILDFKITEGANSGIKYFVDPDVNKGPGSAIGCEFQILDDKNHPDAKMGTNGNRTIGSLYDLITANNLSIEGRGKQFKGIGEWNRARIVSKGGIVEHWLNDEKVVEYDRFSQMFESLVAYSKYKDWEGFGQWPQGHILLQDHGNTVHFRNIKIREF